MSRLILKNQRLRAYIEMSKLSLDIMLHLGPNHASGFEETIEVQPGVWERANEANFAPTRRVAVLDVKAY